MTKNTYYTLNHGYKSLTKLIVWGLYLRMQKAEWRQMQRAHQFKKSPRIRNSLTGTKDIITGSTWTFCF